MRATFKRRYTRTCSFQVAQPDDHPSTGSLLHHLLTLTYDKIKSSYGGFFLLPYPVVTNSFYFQKWNALCCPDFPPASNWCRRQNRSTVFWVQNYEINFVFRMICLNNVTSVDSFLPNWHSYNCINMSYVQYCQSGLNICKFYFSCI